MRARQHAPLLAPLLAFACGILLSALDRLPAMEQLWTAAALALIPAGAGLVAAHRSTTRYAIPLLLPLFLIAGLLSARIEATRPLPAHHLSRFLADRQEASLSGILLAKPILKNERTSFILEADQLLFPDTKDPLPVRGRVRFTVNAPEIPSLVPGGYYQVRGQLSLPKNVGTPGAFDFIAHLASEGIGVTGWVASPLFVEALRVLPEERKTRSLVFLLERFRQDFATFAGKTLDRQEAALYQALLIGDRSSLTPNFLESCQAAGIMHILAISGMHLSVVALLTWLLFRTLFSLYPPIFLWFPARKTALLLSLPILFFYAGIAGFNPPVVRALIMTVVFIAAILLDRQWSSLNNLAIAAFIILLTEPSSLLSVSFELSFIAATAIVLIGPNLQALLTTQKEDPLPAALRQEQARRWQAKATSLCKKGGRALAASLLISLAAFLATAPLALFHFNRISLIGPISTLLLTPPLCLWALPFGLIGTFTLPFSPSVAAFFLKTGAWGLKLAEWLTTHLADLPAASIQLPTPSPAILAFSYLLLLLAWHFRRPLIRLPLLAGFALLLAGFPQPTHNPGLLQISFLDVGKGSATVLELPDGTVALIDGGGPASPGSDVGERIIAPFLWQRQIRKIDLIILTHPHADHFNGLPFLLKTFRPKHLWLSETTSQEPGFQPLLTEAARLGCRVEVAESGRLLASGDTHRLECLVNLASLPAPPGMDPDSATSLNPNNRGLLLRLTHGDKRFIFPGDIERVFEEELVQTGIDLRADLLLAPHHGLRSSGSPAFLEAIDPKYMIISAGRYDPPGIEADGLQLPFLFKTNRNGSIFITSDGKKLTAATYTDIHHRKRSLWEQLTRPAGG